MGPEGRITKKILDHLRSRGAWAIKNHGSPYVRAGLPDIFACYRGRMIAIEVKVPGGTPTPIQAQTLADLENHGALTGVVTSVEETEDLLSRLA